MIKGELGGLGGRRATLNLRKERRGGKKRGQFWQKILLRVKSIIAQKMGG